MPTYPSHTGKIDVGCGLDNCQGASREIDSDDAAVVRRVRNSFRAWSDARAVGNRYVREQVERAPLLGDAVQPSALGIEDEDVLRRYRHVRKAARTFGSRQRDGRQHAAGDQLQFVERRGA